MACQAHNAAHCLHDHVIGRSLAIGAGLSEATGGGKDERRISFMKCFPVIAQFVKGTWTVVFHDHICCFQKCLEGFAVFIIFQVQGNRAFSPIERHKIGRFVFNEGTDMPRIISPFRYLNFDHVSAKVGQKHGAIGTGQDTGQINYFEASKGTRCRGGG